MRSFRLPCGASVEACAAELAGGLDAGKTKAGAGVLLDFKEANRSFRLNLVASVGTDMEEETGAVLAIETAR